MKPEEGRIKVILYLNPMFKMGGVFTFFDVHVCEICIQLIIANMGFRIKWGEPYENNNSTR